MEIFWRLALAHFIADFSLQTNHIAQWKRQSPWGMVVHVLTHPIVSAVLVIPYLATTWVHTRFFSVPGYVCVCLLAFLHYVEDEWRVHAIQKAGSADSTGFFVWDQVIHLTVIAAFVPTDPTWITPRWVFLALCGVLLAHFTSVLIFFMENDLWGSSHVLDRGKYRFITERFVGAALLVLPGAWALIAVPWFGWNFRSQARQRTDRTWVHHVVGNAATLLLSLAARTFLY